MRPFADLFGPITQQEVAVLKEQNQSTMCECGAKRGTCEACAVPDGMPVQPTRAAIMERDPDYYRDDGDEE